MTESYYIDPIRIENNGGCVGQFGYYLFSIDKTFDQHSQIIIAHRANISVQPGAKQVN
jgi:hypothetical protein